MNGGAGYLSLVFWSKETHPSVSSPPPIRRRPRALFRVGKTPNDQLAASSPCLSFCRAARESVRAHEALRRKLNEQRVHLAGETDSVRLKMQQVRHRGPADKKRKITLCRFLWL